MSYSQADIKKWSVIGSRATFGLAALELAKNNNNLYVLTCDVSTSAGLDRFRKLLPEQFIEVGIAEQNMMGIAAGLASENHKVITTTFSPFQTARCCEQIKMNLGYMKNKVVMVGLASGLVLGTLGFSHCSVEDVGILRSIPNITIISPSDGMEIYKALEAALEYKTSCYIRLTGGSNSPIINNADYDFQIGKAVVLKEGSQVTIFSSGVITNECLIAAKKLEEKKISCRVVNMHTIKPIDEEAIVNSFKSDLIVSVEEHNIIGGLGSAIAEVKSKYTNTPKQIFLGIEDKYSNGGEYKHLLKKNRLLNEDIVQTVENYIKNV